MKQHIIVIYKTETENVCKHVTKRHFPGGMEHSSKRIKTGSHSPKEGNSRRLALDTLRGRGGRPRHLAILSEMTRAQLAADVLTAAVKGEN